MTKDVAWVKWMSDREDPVRGLFVGLVRAKFQRENPLGARRRLVTQSGALGGPPGERFLVPDLDLAVRTAEKLGSRVLIFPTCKNGRRFAVVTDAGGAPVELEE